MREGAARRALGKFHPFKVGPIITGGVVVAVVVSGRLIAFLSPPIPAARAQRARPLPPSPSAINSRKDCSRFHFPFSLPQPDNWRITTSVKMSFKNQGSELFGVEVVSIVFASSQPMLLFSRRVHPSSSGFMPLQGGTTIVDSERSWDYHYPNT